MNPPGPTYVVTLPSRTVDELRRETEAAQAAGADVAEVRVDRLPEPEQHRLDRLFPSWLPLLGTYRSRSEGGEGDDSAARRTPLLEYLSRVGFSLVDREIDRDPVLSGPPGVLWVASAHLGPEGVGRVASLLENAVDSATAWTKIVLPASFETLEADVLPNLDPPPRIRYCLHTIGPTGPVLRASAGRLGMAAVYASLPAGANAPPPVEASQLPVDRLRLGGGDPSRPRFALLGHPVSHSLSPELHTTWMTTEKRPGLYVGLDVPTEADFGAAIRILPALGFVGVNVTHPWKFAAFRATSQRSDAVVRTGVANTLTFRPQGLEAENTDYRAVTRRLRELRSQGAWTGDAVVVVGAGGAARSAVVAVEDLGGRSLIVARRREEAARLAHELGAEAPRPGDYSRASLVIHATPAGRRETPTLEVDIAPFLGAGTRLLDFVYRPESPVLASLCRRAGARYEDGERLVRYQAAESYALWWGHRPSLDRSSEPSEGA